MAPSPFETIPRCDILAALSSMGVKLPKSSKMSHEDLTKRLMACLDSSQAIADLFPVKAGEQVDPSKLGLWKNDDRLVVDTHRSSFKQGLDNMMSRGIKKDPAKAKEETFKELQQVLLGFARHWLEGKRVFILMDDTEQWGVFVKIFNVHAVDEGTPLYTLSFRAVSAIPNKSLKRQLEDILAPSIAEIIRVTTTELERKVMLKLLQLNSKRLDPEYIPAEATPKYLKKQWRVSFVLPLGPLPMTDIGKFTDIVGCEVCGSTKGTSRCSSCLSVLYCGTRCQKEDWPRHKAVCRSLKGGTWTTITFGPSASLPSLSGVPEQLQPKDPVYSTLMNWNESLSRNKDVGVRTLGDNPPNVHGDKIFLAKFQVSLFQFGSDAHFLIYDRQRSFSMFWKAKEDPEAFSVARGALREELKMYRFAKWTGDRTMSVCFDRAPAENPPW